MEIVLIYLGTVIVSFIIESNGFQMFKDISDAGYKIGIDKMSEFTNKMRNNQKSGSLLKIFVPVYNLLRAMQIRMQYIQQKNLVLNQLNIIDCIQEMTESEKIEYAKKPTGLNALLISLKSSIEINKAMKIVIEDEGTLWYAFEEKTHELKILKADGLIAKMTLEEQKEKIYEVSRKLNKNFIVVAPFDSFEELRKGLNEAAKNGNRKPTLEKINDLKELKDELTQTKIKSQEEKGHQKTINKDK